MPCLFLQLLPTDLHKLVVEEWISEDSNSQLKVLSALDIACCSRAARQPFRFVAESISFQHEESCCSTRYKYVQYDMMLVVKWLADRRIAAEYLFFPTTKAENGKCTRNYQPVESSAVLPATVRTPSIRVLDIVGHQHCLLQLLWVLQACPNITSISCDLPEHWAQINSILSTEGGPIAIHLRQLTVRRSSVHFPILDMRTVQLLRELHILQQCMFTHLLCHVAQFGAQLVCVEIGFLSREVSLEDLCAALHAMQHLQELTLRLAPASTTTPLDAASVMAALPSRASLQTFILDYARFESRVV